MKNFYQLPEHSDLLAIDLSDEDLRILLSSFIGKLDVTANIYLPNKYNLRSHQYVGIIRLSETEIIIEPKTPINNLSYMLSTVYRLIDWQNKIGSCSSIKELSLLVLLAFLDSLKVLINQGLNQNYQEIKDSSQTIRGRIDFANQFKENPVHLIQHSCEYTEISIDTLENQILKLALTEISIICKQELISLFSQIYPHFNLVKLINLDKINFEQLVFSRLNAHYKVPLALAKMILELSSPNLKDGSKQFPAFLIDMNKLFERYIAEELKDLCQNDLQLDYQTSNYLDINQQLKIIPDLVLRRADQVLAILDTKYQLQETTNSYYQILAYCLAYQSCKGILIYPNWEKEDNIIYIKNSSVVINCVGIVLDKSIKELKSSIEQIISLILK
ncbi:MAG: hypothetical protein WAQ98_29195 [Blastocatellia bacterium]